RLIVEQLPESDRSAAAIVRDLALVHVDRAEPRDREERRLEDAGPVNDAQVRLQAAHEAQRLVRVKVARDQELASEASTRRGEILFGLGRWTRRMHQVEQDVPEAQQRVL